MVPCSGVLGPQGRANVEEEAVGQVEQRRGSCQHLLHGPDELLGLHGGGRGEEAYTLSIQDVAAGWREGGGGKGGEQ